MNKKIIIIIAIAIISLLLIAFVALLALYFWPRQTGELQSANFKKLNYEQAVKKTESIQAKDKKVANRADDCETKLYTHKKQTAKVVVMMHGITACSDQYNSLAKKFFDAGYNVYVPLAPHHGTKNPKEHSNVTTAELADYMNTTLSVASGLGKEVGIIGLSGGANLATWMAQYSGIVSSLLVLSPFYEPAAGAAPKWQVPLLVGLYGYNIAPDAYVYSFSLRALAKYIIVKENYKKDLAAPGLKHVAVVTSENDTNIDLELAHYIPQSLSKENNTTFLQTRLAKEMNVEHDIVRPEDPKVKKHLEQLNDLYFSFYENRQPAK